MKKHKELHANLEHGLSLLASMIAEKVVSEIREEQKLQLEKEKKLAESSLKQQKLDSKQEPLTGKRSFLTSLLTL